VIVPAYNAAATLAEQLEALAAQRFDGDGSW
jgi:glycosyltransferase involved in cell wall biosynthesis